MTTIQFLLEIILDLDLSMNRDTDVDAITMLGYFMSTLYNQDKHNDQNLVNLHIRLV